MPILHFSPVSSTTDLSIIPSGEILMKRLQDEGMDEVEVDWGGIVSTALPVEDDVPFLIDAFRELESFLTGGRDNHEVFLGDGLLQLTARHQNERIVVDLVHTPHLDRRFSQQHQMRLSREEYRASWIHLIDEVCSLAEGD
jgi:hypothetical protein